MDDNNWDIGAVVRNCNINRPSNIVPSNLGSESMNFEKDDWDVFGRLLDVDIDFDLLDDIFPMDFSVAHQEKPYNQSSETINPTTPVSIIADQFKTMDPNDNRQMYLELIQPAQLNQQIFPPPPPPTAVLACEPAPSEAITSQEPTDLQQQLMMWANVHPTFTLSMRSPLIKICERKNQPIRIIYELLQEELTDDTWTWRKYGRKRIKGSPFPRNYYRCSTSELCQAKKQIEKSPKNDKYFLVAYSGIHNHDPPKSRSSHTSWNSSFKDKLPKGISIVPKELSLNASSSSSKHAKRSRDALETESTLAKKKKMVAAAAENKVDGEEEDNMNIEDILTGIEELN